MKASTTILLFLGGVLWGTASAQVEFVGFLTSAEGPRFALKEARDTAASGWLSLGESYRGFKIVAHDEQRALLSVEKNGERLVLPLNETRITPGTAPAPAKPRIGKIAVEFKGATTIPEQLVRDTLQFRSGDDFDDTTLDRSIRALHRTGHFKSIELKREASMPDTVNLKVILTAK